mgnify:CR=1 FL=1
MHHLRASPGFDRSADIFRLLARDRQDRFEDDSARCAGRFSRRHCRARALFVSALPRQFTARGQKGLLAFFCSEPVRGYVQSAFIYRRSFADQGFEYFAACRHDSDLYDCDRRGSRR